MQQNPEGPKDSEITSAVDSAAPKNVAEDVPASRTPSAVPCRPCSQIHWEQLEDPTEEQTRPPATLSESRFPTDADRPPADALDGDDSVQSLGVQGVVTWVKRRHVGHGDRGDEACVEGVA